MLCDTDRWHVSYYFLCEWLSLSHGRWLEYSFHFDNSTDYPQQSQSCTLRDLYVKIPVSYQPQQQSGKTSVPEDLPSLSKFIYANIITAVSISSAYKAAVFLLELFKNARQRRSMKGLFLFPVLQACLVFHKSCFPPLPTEVSPAIVSFSKQLL